MLNRMKSDYLSFIIFMGVFIFILEILLFNTGLVFSFLFSGFLMYIGKKKWHWLVGKAFFVIGLLSVFITIFNTMTLKFLIVATVLYVLYQYIQSKNHPATVKPEVGSERHESVIRHPQKWFQNKLFGTQKTPEHSYTWDDVNIQCGISDTTVDLSYTVLPKGEAIIFIRNVIGNIQVLVPYEVELSVQHSVMVGSTTILEHEEKSIFNQTVNFHTENYKEATQKVKIITSVFVGSLEVKRI